MDFSSSRLCVASALVAGLVLIFANHCVTSTYLPQFGGVKHQWGSFYMINAGHQPAKTNYATINASDHLPYIYFIGRQNYLLAYESHLDYRYIQRDPQLFQLFNTTRKAGELLMDIVSLRAYNYTAGQETMLIAGAGHTQQLRAAYFIFVVLHARGQPELKQPAMALSLAQLLDSGLSLNFNLSEPATGIRNIAVLSSSSGLLTGQPTVALNNGNAKLTWGWPKGNVTAQHTLLLSINVTDNAKGKVAEHEFQNKPETNLNHTHLNFTAVQDGFSQVQVSVTVTYPRCQFQHAPDTFMSVSYVQVGREQFAYRADYSCLPGWVLRGATERFCVGDNQYRPAGQAPYCVRRICPEPNISHCANSGFVHPLSAHKYEAVVPIVCNYGYHPVGSNGSSVCQDHGVSTFQCPVCKATPCEASFPSLPANTKIVNNSLSSTNQIKLQVGQHMLLDCLDGFTHGSSQPAVFASCHLGPRFVRRGFAVQCTPVVCGPLPVPANSYYRVSQFAYNSVATFHCKDQFHQTGGGSSLRCGTDGTWQGTPIICSSGPLATGASSSSSDALNFAVIVICVLVVMVCAAMGFVWYLKRRSMNSYVIVDDRRDSAASP